MPKIMPRVNINIVYYTPVLKTEETLALTLAHLIFTFHKTFADSQEAVFSVFLYS